MSKRGRELSDLLAMRIQQKYGIAKSAGSRKALAGQCRPYGEAAAFQVKSAGSVETLQREIIAKQQELIDHLERTISFSAALLERLAAAQQSGQIRGGFEQFKPSEWEVRRRAGNMVQRHMNGHDHHVPESSGHAPQEP